MACSWFASTLGCAQAGSRLLYSMGVERVLPPALSRVHRRFRTPHVAVALFSSASLTGAAVYALWAQADSAVFDGVVEVGCDGVHARRLRVAALPAPHRRAHRDDRAAAVFVTVLGAGLLACLAVDGTVHDVWMVPATLTLVGSSGVLWHELLRRSRPDSLATVGAFDSVETATSCRAQGFSSWTRTATAHRRDRRTRRATGPGRRTVMPSRIQVRTEGTHFSGQQPQAVQRALGMLEAVAHLGPGTTAKEIARFAGVPPATAYRMLNLLVAEGFLVRVPDLSGFALGRRTAELARAAADTGTLPSLHEAVEETTVAHAVRDPRRVVRGRPAAHRRPRPRPRDRGRRHAVEAPARQRSRQADARVSPGRAPRAGPAPADGVHDLRPRRADPHLRAVVLDGFAHECQESRIGRAALAVPLRDRADHVVGGLYLHGADGRVQPDRELIRSSPTAPKDSPGWCDSALRCHETLVDEPLPGHRRGVLAFDVHLLVEFADHVVVSTAEMGAITSATSGYRSAKSSRIVNAGCTSGRTDGRPRAPRDRGPRSGRRW